MAVQCHDLRARELLGPMRGGSARKASGILKGRDFTIADVYGRLGKSVISVCIKKAKKGLQMRFMALKDTAFVIYFKNSAFTAVKRGTKF